jgi:rhamnosyltransferase subunit B
MNRPGKIVLSTFGSFGDIHPYMAIALELKSRGHEATIATMEFYREKILDAGLGFAPVRPNVPGPKEQNAELVERIMDPRTGPKFLMEDLIFPAVRDSYEDLLHASRGADLLVTHPAAPAGPLVGYKTEIPWISTVLAPMSFFSHYDPPVPPYWPWLNELRVLGPGFMKFFHDVMKSVFKPEQVTALRDELSVADYGNPVFEGQHSPTLVLALFSELFGPRQPDWPKQARTTGFCFYDEDQEPMSRELSNFLDNGPPPIIFTLGSSAVWVARDFFADSIKAAQILNRRAVLLVGDERNRPESLSMDMIAVDYAPYHSVFSRACAVVHHGGVGTTSHGLRSGAPTLIVPFAFDQPDNAEHARRLGTSRTLYRKNHNARSAAHELQSLLTDPSYAQRASYVSERLKQENGPRCAADLIEQIMSDRLKAVEEPAYAFGN